MTAPLKEYRMSTIQIFSLIGIVTGLMFGAFYIGAYFGKKVGFESAMTSNLKYLSKVPISTVDTGNDEVDENISRKVAKKLKAELGNKNSEKSELLALDDEEKNEKKEVEKINILNADKVPNILGKDERKLGDVYVEDVDLDKNSKKDTDKKNEKKEDTIIVDKEDSQMDDVSMGENVKEVKRKIEEQFDKKEEADKVNIKKDNKKDEKSNPIKDSKKNIVIPTVGILKDEKGTNTELAKKQVNKINNEPTLVVKVMTPEIPRLKEDNIKLNVPSPAIEQARVSARGFYVQVQASSNYNEASSLVRKIKESGFKANIESANVRGQTYYRVLVGPEETRLYTERMIEQLKGESFITSTPFIVER